MSNSLDSHIQHTFDSYCKKVIRNEARNIQKQKAKLNKYQISFSTLTEEILNELVYEDKHIGNSHKLRLLNNTIEITNSLLFDAINRLTENKRKIILLFYFCGFNDREIAELNHMSISGIWYQRQMANEEMRKYLEEEYYG